MPKLIYSYWSKHSHSLLHIAIEYNMVNPIFVVLIKIFQNTGINVVLMTLYSS